MTNFEYYKYEIEKFLLEHGNVKFAIVNDEVIDCNSAEANCFACLFNDKTVGLWCSNVRKRWLNAEHEEPITKETLKNGFYEFCNKHHCKTCEPHIKGEDCKFAWLLENYNVTKKEDDTDVF